jgi:hypothetical protein
MLFMQSAKYELIMNVLGIINVMTIGMISYGRISVS